MYMFNAAPRPHKPAPAPEPEPDDLKTLLDNDNLTSDEKIMIEKVKPFYEKIDINNDLKKLYDVEKEIIDLEGKHEESVSLATHRSGFGSSIIEDLRKSLGSKQIERNMLKVTIEMELYESIKQASLLDEHPRIFSELLQSKMNVLKFHKMIQMAKYDAQVRRE